VHLTKESKKPKHVITTSNREHDNDKHKQLKQMVFVSRMFLAKIVYPQKK